MNEYDITMSVKYKMSNISDKLLPYWPVAMAWLLGSVVETTEHKAVMPSSKRWYSAQLDQENCLDLDQILRVFSAPITEEHAWAVIYQVKREIFTS